MDGQVYAEHKPERVVDYFVVVGLDPDIVVLEDEAFCDDQGGQGTGSDGGDDGDDGGEGALSRVLRTRYRAAVLDRFPAEDHPDTALPPQVAMFALPEGLTVKETCPLPTFCIVVFTSNEGKRLYASVLTFHEEVPAAALDRMLQPNPPRQDPRAREPRAHKTLWLPKCICSLSHWLFFEVHREFLKQLYRVSLTASRVPIERLICNLIHEVPLPPRGRVRVQYSIADQTCELSRAPANQIPFAHVPLDMLFHLLDRHNVLKLVTCVLLEYKILLYSEHAAVLTMVAEAVLALIFPFTWDHVYIPVLPLQLLEFVNAPTPFIMGVQPGPLRRKYSGASAESILGEWSPDDVVKVNLDENRVVCPASDPLPPLPQKLQKKLLDHLHSLVGDYDGDKAAKEEARMDLAFSMAPTPAESEGAAKKHRSLDGAITAQLQYAFFRLFLSLLRNYREFLVKPSSEDPEPQELFRKRAFLQATPREARRFLARFIETQMFNVFIEKRVYASGSDHDHVLFDESMDAKANRSALRLHKRPTPFLDDKRHAFTHTHVALAPSEEGLPPVPQHPGAEGDGGTRSFPKLDPLLFGKPRAVRSLVSGNLLHQAPGGRARCHSVGHGAGLSQSLGALHKHAPLALSTDRLSSACSPGKEGDADMRESIYGMWFCLHLLLIQDLQALRGSSSSSTPRTSLASTPRETPRSNGSSGAESGAGQRGGTGSKDTEQATEARRLMHLAMCVLRRMQHLQLRVGEGVYRALIEASGRAGCHQQAVALLEEMQERGLRPDAWVYGCLITAVADSQECVTPQGAGNAGSAGNAGTSPADLRAGVQLPAPSVSLHPQDTVAQMLPPLEPSESSHLAWQVAEGSSTETLADATSGTGGSATAEAVSHRPPPPTPPRRDGAHRRSAWSASGAHAPSPAPASNAETGPSNAETGASNAETGRDSVEERLPHESVQGPHESAQGPQRRGQCQNPATAASRSSPATFVASVRRVVKRWPWEEELSVVRARPSVVTWWTDVLPVGERSMEAGAARAATGPAVAAPHARGPHASRRHAGPGAGDTEASVQGAEERGARLARSAARAQRSPSVVTWWSADGRDRGRHRDLRRALALASSPPAHPPPATGTESGSTRGGNCGAMGPSRPLDARGLDSRGLHARVPPSIVTWRLFVAPPAHLHAPVQGAGAGGVDGRVCKEGEVSDVSGLASVVTWWPSAGRSRQRMSTRASEEVGRAMGSGGARGVSGAGGAAKHEWHGRAPPNLPSVVTWWGPQVGSKVQKPQAPPRRPQSLKFKPPPLPPGKPDNPASPPPPPPPPPRRDVAASGSRAAVDTSQSQDTQHALPSASAHQPASRLYAPDADGDAPTATEACGASMVAAPQAYAVHEMTVCDTCPQCGVVMQEEEVRRGWRLDEHDYTTQCKRCAHRFVARFTVRSFAAAPNMTRSPQNSLEQDSLECPAVDASRAPAAAALGARGGTDDAAQVRDGHLMPAAEAMHFECLSPLVVHKEMTTLLGDLEVMSGMPTRMGSEHDASGAAPGAEAGEKDETGEKDQTTVASAQLPPRFIHFLRIRQPSIFWSLVLHLIFCQLPLNVVLENEHVILQKGVT